MTHMNYIILIIVISIIYVRTKSCDIIENMSCDCHSSFFHGEIEQLICNNYKNNPINSTIKLIEETNNIGHTFDSFHLTFHNQEINISSKFINSLSRLFPRPSSSSLNEEKQKSKIKITLSFPNFLQLHFEDYAFYQLFDDKSDYITILILELTANGQITFSSMAFHQLIVDQMFLHSSSLEPYSFEEIFNNTKIGELTLEGVTPRSNNTYKMNFNGKIRLAKFTKMVETVSNEEFPEYPVHSMIIEAHEARKINASTFSTYRNLHGFHLIRPKFFFDNRSFDGFQYITSLESIELDAETLKDHTFQHASRINFLTLGPNTRYLAEHSLDDLDYLKRFDVSKIILDQLYPSSRCVIARYIKKQQQFNPLTIILPPQAEYCDCIYDFILAILNRKADQSYIDSCSENQEERCQLSQCNVVKNFHFSFKENLNTISSIDENIIDTTIDDGLTTTHRLPSYVHQHPYVNHQPEADRIDLTHIDTPNSHASALKGNKVSDPNAIPDDDYDENVNPTSTKTSINDEARLIAMKNETLKWISISLVCITILCLLLIGTLIWFFTCRLSMRRNKAGFQRVLASSSNV